MDMLNRILDSFIGLVVDGLEDFFSVISYPTKEYIRTALFIACGFFVFSVAGFVLGYVVFVDWYEALTAVIILGLIYLTSFISEAQVSKITNGFKNKTELAKNKIKSISKKGVIKWAIMLLQR